MVSVDHDLLELFAYITSCRWGWGWGWGTPTYKYGIYSEPDEDVSMRVGGKGALTDT